MAQAKVKNGKTVVTLTMGPKEAAVIQSLVENCASNSHAYRIAQALSDIMEPDYDSLPTIAVGMQDEYPVIWVEQR